MSDEHLNEFQKGAQLLKEGHVRRAERVADGLIAKRYTGGIELKARCLCAKGEETAAITLLEEGVKRYPSICNLWDLLGEYYSNAERFQDSLAAFQQSKVAGGDEGIANYNLAITYVRMGDYDTAAQFSESVGETVHPVQRLDLRVLVAIGKREYDKALTAAEELIIIAPDLCSGHGQRALALQNLGRPAEARVSALMALKLDKTEGTALHALSLQNPECDDATRGYELCVLHKPKAGNDPFPGLRVDGYFRFCSVAAKSPDEALAYYRDIASQDCDYELLECELASDTVGGHEGVRRIDKMTYSYAMEANPLKRVGLMVQARRYRPPEN
jgi:tetratricopeptide (TPR) repeat protein